MSARLNPRLTKRAQVNAMQSLSLTDNSQSGTLASSVQRTQQLSDEYESESELGTSRSGTTETGSESTSSQRDSVSSLPLFQQGQLAINPRLHLMHCGQWIPKEFEVGRWKDGTGVWNCCGHQVNETT